MVRPVGQVSTRTRAGSHTWTTTTIESSRPGAECLVEKDLGGLVTVVGVALACAQVASRTRSGIALTGLGTDEARPGILSSVLDPSLKKNIERQVQRRAIKVVRI